MSNSRNNVNLIGRITKDPVVRKTQKNEAAVQFALAVPQNFVTADKKRNSDFPYCVAYGKTAEFIGAYIRKGDLLSIQGELRTRTYKDKNGQNVFHTEVVCRDVSPLEPRAKREERNKGTEPTQPDYGMPEPPPTLEEMESYVPIDETVPF